jgi:hypothetical protein
MHIIRYGRRVVTELIGHGSVCYGREERKKEAPKECEEGEDMKSAVF